MDILAESLPESVIRTGHCCVGFEQDETTARVRFSNGTISEAELVIGADGIHSALRPHVTPPSEPVFSGSGAYRGTIPHEWVPDWPTDAWQMWLGKKKHFLAFPLRAGKLINYVGFVPADEVLKESWSAPGDPEKLRAEFAGWDPMIEHLLAHVDYTFRWALCDRDPLPTWTKGRLTESVDQDSAGRRILTRARSQVRCRLRSRTSRLRGADRHRRGHFRRGRDGRVDRRRYF